MKLTLKRTFTFLIVSSVFIASPLSASAEPGADIPRETAGGAFKNPAVRAGGEVANRVNESPHGGEAVRAAVNGGASAAAGAAAVKAPANAVGGAAIGGAVSGVVNHCTGCHN